MTGVKNVSVHLWAVSIFAGDRSVEIVGILSVVLELETTAFFSQGSGGKGNALSRPKFV
ncbi:hypothetical protein [Bradyrhizobium sp. BR 1433]|uniref:hypothetical protein n=1 Tax=Bradyrhizobium sp. BR 1433 TaxID=3447967 RepID=UPI003EE53693